MNSCRVSAFDPEERREYVLKHLHSRFESFENLMHDAGAALPFRPSNIHPFTFSSVSMGGRYVSVRK